MILPRFTAGLVVTFALMMAGGARSAQEAIDRDGIEFFEAKIRPVLVEHCYRCHSRSSSKLKGGLYLDSRGGLLRGGDSGPAIVPGRPEESRLIRAVRYENEELEMPPAGKLPEGVVRDLVLWVKRGAPDPRDQPIPAPPSKTAAPAPDSHWAFRLPEKPIPPAVRSEDRVRTPIDRFILARLEGAGLTLAAAADRRTWLRRVTFDLIGLPPTPEEIAAFEQDDSEEAFETVLDRLLASPNYGERWGRHWLDVARYADTKGYTFGERRFPYAYAYRDWVIRAFNEDLPYDRFLVEQIAADQLELGEDRRALAAMGFLTIGRRFLNNKPDIIDDRIDVVSRGLMALTVGCARCHSHKYDPIPTQDYYSLYGVFASSVEPEEPPLLATPHRTPRYEAYLKELKAREDAVRKFRDDRGRKLLNALRSPETIAAYVLAAHRMRDLHENDLKPNARKQELNPEVLPRWWRFLKQSNDGTDSLMTPWHQFAALAKADFAGEAPDVTAALKKLGTVDPRVIQAFDEPPMSMEDVGARYGKLLASDPSVVDEVLFSSLDWLANLFYPNGGPDRKRPENLVDELFVDDDRKQLGKLKKRVKELEFTHAGAPPRGMVLVDAAEPVTARVFIRGNPKNLGEVVPRWFLGVAASGERRPFRKGSGRLELARAIASRENPLTARVMVNRIWMHHFGEGLVRTPSDFGIRSDPPSHPGLLDWLAVRFMEGGWSIKKLHRLILRSAVYRQGGEGNPRGLQVDPRNTLLWRMNARRLDLEAMRDSMLAVAGRLDRRVGGRSEKLLTSRRRTLYGYLNRQEMQSIFRTFDFAIPDTHSPRRATTTVPQQALYLMNSGFVMEQAKHLATRKDVVAEKTVDGRVRRLYRICYGREATPPEAAAAARFLGAEPLGERWAEYAQVLLKSNEFVFVD